MKSKMTTLGFLFVVYFFVRACMAAKDTGMMSGEPNGPTAIAAIVGFSIGITLIVKLGLKTALWFIVSLAALGMFAVLTWGNVTPLF